MYVAPVTETEVEQVIEDFKNNSSAAFDKILAFLVKQCLCYSIKTMVHVYNVSVQTGIFPGMMKKAKIKPLFKNGDRQDIQNYRPIFILFVFSKPLEKINVQQISFVLKKA
jgi:hypothetical protein